MHHLGFLYWQVNFLPLAPPREPQAKLVFLNEFSVRSFEFSCSSFGKESACSTGDLGLIPGSGRFPGEENGNPLQYSCLENPMGRRAWQVTVYGVARVRHNLATKPPKDFL